MQNTLRKTLIKLDESTQLQFYKISKFTRFGCKAVFFNPISNGNKNIENNIYDVTVLSRSLLQLNSICQQILKNLQEYKNMNSNISCSIYSVADEGDIIYIISKGQRYKLSDLVEKRQGLTEFQIIFFVLNLVEVMNHLKQYKFFYQAIDLDQIYLTKQMKLLIPFSIWTCSTIKIKPMALRHQDKKNYIAPQLLSNNTDISADEVNSWNVGVFIYELIEGVKPFIRNTTDLTFNREVSPQISQLLQKLLKRNTQQRLKFPLILLQNLFKKYSSLPHILPATIFSCPPSSEYISQYCRNFQQKKIEKPDRMNKILNVQTAHFIEDINSQNTRKPQVFSFKSTKYIKPSDRSITQNRSYITEFVDISHVFGYGYQMNTGLICFVFNDGSQMYFENSMKKNLRYITQKGIGIDYPYQKITEESDIKKKLFILEAYVKSIQKFKHNTSNQSKVIVSQYFKTNSAAVFLLSNQTIQLIFNDKMIIILTKHKIYIQNKSSDKFECYESLQETSDLVVRKKYALTMAEKLFHWQTIQLQKIRSKVQPLKQLGNHNQYQSHGRRNYNISIQ